MCKLIKKYLAAHPYYNAAVHTIIGIGIGALITYPYFGAHPLRWGVGLVVVGILGHLYPMVIKK